MKKLTAKSLIKLAGDKRSIVTKQGVRMPVAVLISMPFRTVMNYLESGVTVYKKKRKKTPWRSGPFYKDDKWPLERDAFGG